MDDKEPLKILSIDAWRGPEGWWWNDHRKVGEISREVFATLDTTRKLLTYMRKHGYLSARSAGRVSLDDGGGYDDVFVEIRARGTGEPLFAISGIH